MRFSWILAAISGQKPLLLIILQKGAKVCHCKDCTHAETRQPFGYPQRLKPTHVASFYSFMDQMHDRTCCAAGSIMVIIFSRDTISKCTRQFTTYRVASEITRGQVHPSKDDRRESGQSEMALITFRTPCIASTVVGSDIMQVMNCLHTVHLLLAVAPRRSSY